MNSERYLGNAFRFECPSCGLTRTDYGPDAVLQIEVHHRCEEDDVTIIETAWAQLDEQVAEIMELNAGQGRARQQDNEDEVVRYSRDLAIARARARGKAEILALLMRPYYSTADEVAAEATRRWDLLRRGETPNTKGLRVAWQPGMALIDEDGNASTYDAEDS